MSIMTFTKFEFKLKHRRSDGCHEQKLSMHPILLPKVGDWDNGDVGDVGGLLSGSPAQVAQTAQVEHVAWAKNETYLSFDCDCQYCRPKSSKPDHPRQTYFEFWVYDVEFRRVQRDVELAIYRRLADDFYNQMGIEPLDHPPTDPFATSKLTTYTSPLSSPSSPFSSSFPFGPY